MADTENPQEPSKSALKKLEKQAKMAAAKAEKAVKQTVPVVDGKKDKKLIGITASKSTDFSAWYLEVVTKSGMIEYYNEIAGFFILLPPSMYIWETIQEWFTGEIRKLGVKPASFPMFLSAQSLEKEKDHVEGFAPELAWVTKAGTEELANPVAVRPTSEALMYPYFAKWIRSHNDLPFRLNQWCNVVRWEAKQTVPFLRQREFLWQEGHTAHMTEELASEEVYQILDFYAKVYEELLAVPVVKGKKTEAEKFAGGHWTTTCESFIPANGRGIQGATSHCLGQNFSKMFKIQVEDPENKGEKLFVWQNSWGLSTRCIGVMAMVHSDDKGLVLPPRVAEIQVIIIPVGITAKTTAEDRDSHAAKVEVLKATLRAAGVRVDIDKREGYRSGWKFSDWELKGVPLRVEFGPQDAAKNVITAVRRDTGEELEIAIPELAVKIPELLETIQKALFEKADVAYREHRLVLEKWDEVVPALDSRNVVIIPFCGGQDCEKQIKDSTKSKEVEYGPDGKALPSMGMKSLCIPSEQPKPLAEGTKCLNPECSTPASFWTMFGRSY